MGRRDASGKSLAFLDLLDKFGDEIESDLSRYHRIRLIDVINGEFSLREIFVYLSQLPPDSSFKSSQVTKDGNGWGVQEMLLARLVEEITFYRFEYRRSQGSKEKPPPSLDIPGREIMQKQAQRDSNPFHAMLEMARKSQIPA